MAEPEELTPEEEERLRLRKIEAEKQNASRQEAWAALSEDEKFYQTAENKEKESHIEFPDNATEAEGDEPVQTNSATVTLDRQALKRLEA